jgi:hypothetical protein
MAEELGTVHTSGRGLLRGWCWPVDSNLVFDHMAASVPGKLLMVLWNADLTVWMSRIQTTVIRKTGGFTRYDGWKPLFQMSSVWSCNSLHISECHYLVSAPRRVTPQPATCCHITTERTRTRPNSQHEASRSLAALALAFLHSCRAPANTRNGRSQTTPSPRGIITANHLSAFTLRNIREGFGVPREYFGTT